MKHMVFVFQALFLALLFSCTNQLAGNSSEITNGFCIAEATPADSAIVVAYPFNYVPSSGLAGPETTYTDKHGNFSIQLGYTGWNLVIYDRARARGAFVPLPSGDSAVDTIVLKHLGSISGIVNDTMNDTGFVGIAGSPFYAEVIGKSDSFSLNKIPPFYYNVIVWRLGTTVIASNPINQHMSTLTSVGSSSVAVWPDSTTTVIINP
jgi:hypothetical protein